MNGARKPPRGVGRWTMLLFVGGAAPAAFAVETLVSAVVLPAEFEVVRAELRPTATAIAWGMLVACIPAVVLGHLTKRWLVRRGLARSKGEPSPEQRARVELEALLLATSIPQLPALLATVAAMFGAVTTPVLATLAVSTVGVVVQGLGSSLARGADGGRA